MSEIKALEKLRESSHIDDNKGMLEDGETVQIYYGQPDDLHAVNFGEQWREIADEIEAEIDEKYMERPVDVDGVPWIAEDSKFDAVAEGTIDLDMIAYSVKTGRWYLLDDRRMTYTASICRHVKPRTLEDVLSDVWEEALDYAQSDIWRNPDEVFAERANEIREIMNYDVCEWTPKEKGTNRLDGRDLYDFETSCGARPKGGLYSLPNYCSTCGKKIKVVK